MTQELLDNTVLEIVKIVAPGLLGGLGAWWAMRVNSKREQQKKDKEANAKLKIHYLNPLRVSAQVLCNRLINAN